MVPLNEYRGRVMLYLFRLNGHVNEMEMLDYIEEEFGAYPDGLGNLFFDTEEQESWFILRFS